MSSNDNQPAVFQGDLSDALCKTYLKSRRLAVDTETLGLNTYRDRLCVVQMCDDAGTVSMVQVQGDSAPNLKKVMESTKVEKVFHFARFDIAALRHWLDIEVTPVFCTKIASKLSRTYTDSHGLKSVVAELTNVQLDKMQQSSDWAAETLSPQQIQYAASDVIYLIEVRNKLEKMLKREKRLEMAQACFEFLPHRVTLDLAGWGESDIFSHR